MIKQTLTWDKLVILSFWIIILLGCLCMTSWAILAYIFISSTPLDFGTKVTLDSYNELVCKISSSLWSESLCKAWRNVVLGFHMFSCFWIAFLFSIGPYFTGQWEKGKLKVPMTSAFVRCPSFLQDIYNNAVTLKATCSCFCADINLHTVS